jgi:hypothetical protein
VETAFVADVSGKIFSILLSAKNKCLCYISEVRRRFWGK